MKPAKLSLITALALGALVAIAPAARAQDNPDKKDATKSEQKAASGQRTRRNGQAAIDHLATQLKLSDDQKAKVQPILQDEAKKLRDLRQDTAQNTRDRRAKVREIREKSDEQMKPILSKDQFAQYKKIREEARNNAVKSRTPAAPAEKSSSDTNKQ